MSYPTAVNSQVTDAVTQANLEVLGSSPALSSDSVYVSTAQSLANAAHNAVAGQAQAWMTSQASLVAGLRNILGLDPASHSVKRELEVLEEERRKAHDPADDAQAAMDAEACVAASRYSLGL